MPVSQLSLPILLLSFILFLIINSILQCGETEQHGEEEDAETMEAIGEAHMSYAFQVQDGEVEEEKEAARKEEEQREMEEQSQGEKAMD